jgi:hypothetical protein
VIFDADKKGALAPVVFGHIAIGRKAATGAAWLGIARRSSGIFFSVGRR